LTTRLLPLLFLLFLLSPLQSLAEPADATTSGTVTWVYDGDTLEINPYGKVRLIGIDTPERENSPRDNYLIEQGIPASHQRTIYQAAKHFNIEKVKGKLVTLVLDEPTHDRHGRLLAYVKLPDGRILNQVLIEKGLAVVYRRFNFTRKDDFLAAESIARQAHVGIWSELQ